MKLSLLFIVMELLTILAYPIVFVHGKLRRSSNSGGSIPPVNISVAIPVTSVR